MSQTVGDFIIQRLHDWGAGAGCAKALLGKAALPDDIPWVTVQSDCSAPNRLRVFRTRSSNWSSARMVLRTGSDISASFPIFA
jgi:hypothetical protein